MRTSPHKQQLCELWLDVLTHSDVIWISQRLFTTGPLCSPEFPPHSASSPKVIHISFHTLCIRGVTASSETNTFSYLKGR